MKVLSPISRLLLCAVLLPSSACDKRESKVYGVIIWGHCSRIHKKLVRLEEAGQFPAWHDYPGSNILERFTM